MASSNLLKTHLTTTIKFTRPTPTPSTRTLLPSHQIPQHYRHPCRSSFFPYQTLNPRFSALLSIQSSLSSSNPPASRAEAIVQAKTCLSTTLEKPLNNPKLSGKLKKIKQPKFQVEIPVIDDDSPSSLSQLALEVFGDLPIRRKGVAVKTTIIWPNPTLREAAYKTFESSPSSSLVEHVDISSLTDTDIRVLNTTDFAVFLAPEASQLEDIKTVTDSLNPKPVVIFNPKWNFEEESNFGDLSGFVGSFEVIYSFMGLEVKGILSKRKGVIFKCVRDGVLSGERWSVLVEEEGELKVISRFKSRPSIGEVETVLYNLMAINSPITKSAKFLRELVSNVTGQKKG
ncbi:protein of unknown function DUF1995 [Dillenia turbinata]|uniref:DUF1995 domain-containing protein n=1 Tax=Dillenia turbinata TaxID=194707 RepID=A0AAN8WF66_9MAGN